VINRRKFVRDALIVAVIVVVAWFLVKSNRPGPVEQTTATDSSAQDANALPAGHGEPRPELTAGEPVVRVGDRWIGKDWFDDLVRRKQGELSGQEGLDPEMIAKYARISALITGLNEIIQTKAIQDWDIQPDQAYVAEEEKNFNSSFQSAEEAQAFLDEMHMSKDRLEAKWSEDSRLKALMDKVTGMSGVEPGTEEADNAFADWMDQQIAQADISFPDPEMKALYDEYLQIVAEAKAGQMSTSGGEEALGSGDMNGGMPAAPDTNDGQMPRSTD
jgi:hypothetical protein